MSSPAVTRKRSRADLDEDELSPEKGKMTTPLASIKKRKLNMNGSSPAGGTVLSSLKRRVTGIFGWKAKEKENLRAEEEEDELASGVSLDTNDGKHGAPEKDIWDIEVSESEEDTGPKRRNDSERTRSISTPNRPKAASNKGSAKSNHVSGADELAEDIWEVPEEDASARRSARKYTSSVEIAKAYLAPVSDDKERPAARSPGRPKKSQILKEAKKLSNKAVRERMMAAGSENEDEEDETGITTKTRKAGRSRREESQAHTAPQSAASTDRKRGRPRKVSIDISESARQVPKGILTPSKQKAGRPRKSVAFEEEGEVNLGFKDLPGKKSKNATPGNEKEPEEVESDEADDIACALCSGLDSKKKNPIIICEKCDYSVHQKCYKLSVVPEGDWFCKDCQPTQEPETEDGSEEEIDSDAREDIACAICSGLDSKKKNPIIICDGCDYVVHKKCYQVSAIPQGDWFCKGCESKTDNDVLFPQLDDDLDLAGSSNNLPDIEGFEEHLRRMQRTILDRLTGQKRIRLRGYDDEMQKVHQVVEQTVLAGEGNSMLVIGPRGCGKTTVSSLESTLSDHANMMEAC
jgi:origin recognition complex subunit 4